MINQTRKKNKATSIGNKINVDDIDLNFDEQNKYYNEQTIINELFKSKYLYDNLNNNGHGIQLIKLK